MTQEEILQYNQRCAEFLGMDNDAFLLEKQIEKNTGLCHLKFHSDWNWIMEVVDAIENTKCDFKINTLWNEFNQCSYTQVSVIKEVGEMSKDRKVISNSVKVYEKHSNTYKNKKEAVVQAIYEFLIWYEENKS